MAFGRVGECLSTSVSVPPGDNSADESARGTCPGDGEGSEPAVVRSACASGDRIVHSDTCHALGVAALEEVMRLGLEQADMYQQT